MGVDRIDGRTGLPAADQPAQPGRADGAFAAMLPPAGQAAPGAVRSAGMAGLAASAWAAAAAGTDAPPEARDRQARRHGRAMLRALAAVQRALLAEEGGHAAAALAALAASLGQAQEAEDPVLQLILREIAVRAAVELARHDMAQDVATG